MMNKILTTLLAVSAFLASCTSTRQTTSGNTTESDDARHVFLDTMEIQPDEDVAADTTYPYRPSRDRNWDLTHTVLDISFDWNNSAVIGTATLTLSPLFYPQSSLTLDAVNFDIKKVLVNGTPAQYQYDKSELTIQLDKSYTRRDKITVVIDYIAHPSPDKDQSGTAISSDQGLFFIDPLDTIPEVPRQIWTQGETSNNRRWFPTFDQPNERMTQEIILTVDDTLMTLSNGSLITSTKLNNGMRRDHWKLELPHAPYLAMVAVGQWDKVSDTWRGRPVDYYVDPGYGKDARHIFANTPEMIDFFSEKLGYDFVWPKYSQIIVKDFVSGAMENTTAVVFGDFIQFHEEDVIGEGVNDYIVSHELFHHWFGDLVTTESWANLTLNEGFANYAEYMWFEHKYGREKADLHRMQELTGYFDQVEYDAHPLIHYHYRDENAMFDAHSYNKGGLVLHMLRDLVGDEAFFASLRLYLQRHAYSSVEADDLRQAFEEITGKDLNWFFDQWFFGKGHPVLEIKHNYDASRQQLDVMVLQHQAEQGYYAPFKLPLEFATYDASGKATIHKVWLDQNQQSFTLDVNEAPVAVVLDPRDILLTVLQQEIPESEYETRLLYTPSISHRVSAFRVMSDLTPATIEKMVADSSQMIRALSIQYLLEKGDDERLLQLSATEKDPELQYYILQSLMELDSQKAKIVAEKLITTTKKNPVIFDALTAIAAVDLDAALQHATRFQNNPSPALYAAQANLYAKKGSGVTIDYFKSEQAKKIPIDYLEEFITSLALYLSKQSAQVQQEGLDLIASDFYLQGPIPQYRRFYLLTGLWGQYVVEMNNSYKNQLKKTIKKVYEGESDTYLRQILKEGFGAVLD